MAAALLAGHSAELFHNLVRVAVVTCCVPATHAIGGPLLHPGTWGMWLPFVGGAGFLWLQALAWLFWIGSIVAAALPLLQHLPLACPPALRPWLPEGTIAASAAAGSLVGLAIAECLMISSLLIFERSARKAERRACADAAKAKAAGAPTPPSLPRPAAAELTPAAARCRKRDAAALVIGMSALLSLLGGGSLLCTLFAPLLVLVPQGLLPLAWLEPTSGAAGLAGSESVASLDEQSQLLYSALSAACFLVAVPLTHGLGGRLRHEAAAAAAARQKAAGASATKAPAGASPAAPGTRAVAGWAFWQPFRGGTRFVAAQAAGWALFSLSLCCLAVVIGHWAGAVAGSPLAASVAGGLSRAAAAASVSVPRPSARGLGQWIAAISASAGICGLLAQLLVACSLLQFQSDAAVVRPVPPPEAEAQATALAAATAAATAASKAAAVPPAVLAAIEAGVPVDIMSGPLPGGWALRRRAEMLTVLLMIYAPAHLLVATLALPYVLLPPGIATAVLAVVGSLYSLTYVGAPHRSGSRGWATLDAWFCGVIEDAATRWFGRVQVISVRSSPPPSAPASPAGSAKPAKGGKGAGKAAHGGAPAAAPVAPPRTRTVIGYHPHGLYPAGAVWFHKTTAFKRLFPSMRPVTLTASSLLHVPLLRDIVLWAGTREVSRRVFASTLKETGAVVVCPGGQSEMVDTHASERQIVLHAHHRGFVRMALTHDAELLPVFCFGEGDSMRNLLAWRAAMRWTYKRVGFPVPFLLGGYGTLLPMPKQRHLTFVVGAPLRPDPADCAAVVAGGEAGEAAVVRVTEAYYASVAELFEAHKEACGYGDFTLVLKHH